MFPGTDECTGGATSYTLVFQPFRSQFSSRNQRHTPARASPTLHLPARWAAVPLSGWTQKASRSTQQCRMPSPERRTAQRRSGEAPHQEGSGTGSRAPVPGRVSSDARHRERGSHRVRSVALAERYVPVLPRHCRPREARQLRARGGSGPPPAMRHNEQSLPSPPFTVPSHAPATAAASTPTPPPTTARAAMSVSKRALRVGSARRKDAGTNARARPAPELGTLARTLAGRRRGGGRAREGRGVSD